MKGSIWVELLIFSPLYQKWVCCSVNLYLNKMWIGVEWLQQSINNCCFPIYLFLSFPPILSFSLIFVVYPAPQYIYILLDPRSIVCRIIWDDSLFSVLHYMQDFRECPNSGRLAAVHHFVGVLRFPTHARGVSVILLSKRRTNVGGTVKIVRRQGSIAISRLWHCHMREDGKKQSTKGALATLCPVLK